MKMNLMKNSQIAAAQTSAELCGLRRRRVLEEIYLIQS